MLNLITVLILSGAIAPSEVKAASGSDILVNVVPSSPAPYEDVSITLNSYAANLDTVLITWSLNNKSVASGIGQKSFSLKAPTAGLETVVIGSIALPEGEIETRIIIRPSVMVLLYQANDSYVPPFYRGKALPSAESEVKVVAMPEIKSGSGFVNSKNMTYAWKKDYSNDVGGSGYGKNYFLYINDYLEDLNNISVTAETIDQKYSSEASINIGTVQPKIIFYKNDSALGTIWENVLTNPHRVQETEVIEATPYFISPKEILNPRLIWNWSINDSILNILSFRKNIIPLAVQGEISGTSKLKLQIENKDKIFQTANKEINIEF